MPNKEVKYPLAEARGLTLGLLNDDAVSARRPKGVMHHA